jgi:hypothetical protein
VGVRGKWGGVVVSGEWGVGSGGALCMECGMWECVGVRGSANPQPATAVCSSVCYELYCVSLAIRAWLPLGHRQPLLQTPGPS